jgi:UPF0716 family protein affecting phage T7 exclusion
MLKRLPILIGAIIVLDILAKIIICWQVDWKIPLFKTISTAILGLLVIVYYECRWSNFVADRLTQEPGFLDSLSREKLLLLVAGLMLVLPGFLCDFVGLLLLLPSGRRWISRKCCLYCPDVTSDSAQNGFSSVQSPGGTK